MGQRGGWAMCLHCRPARRSYWLCDIYGFSKAGSGTVTGWWHDGGGARAAPHCGREAAAVEQIDGWNPAARNACYPFPALVARPHAPRGPWAPPGACHRGTGDALASHSHKVRHSLQTSWITPRIARTTTEFGGLQPPLLLSASTRRQGLPPAGQNGNRPNGRLPWWKGIAR